MAENKIRALVVDVSATMRILISHMLSADPDFEVIGAIPDISLARERIPRMQLDVITFNAALAGWASIAALNDLVRAHQLPVVVLGSRTHPEWFARYANFDPHRVHYLPLAGATCQSVEGETATIVASVRSAARRGRMDRQATASGTQKSDAGTAKPRSTRANSRQIIAIGASTGGTQAIAEVLKSFPADAPATVIVQHMPPGFTSTFARHLDKAVEIEVKEAEEGDEVRTGRALIAPAGRHLEIVRSGTRYQAHIIDTDPVNRHRPSVDVLFNSVAQIGGRNAVGAILTGMGNDGAAGMMRMHNNGALTIAQDEATCVVFGMPREAIKLNGVNSVLPLSKIGRELIAMARR